MIVKSRDGVLLLRADMGGEELAVPLEGITPISVTIDRKGLQLAAAALLPGGRAPSIYRASAYRGDFRVLRCSIEAPKWRLVDDRFGIDPTWFPDSERIAFCTATGPALAEPSNAVTRTNVGRFGWGPPAVSVNPSGTRIGFVRWRSDRAYLGVWNLDSVKPRVFPLGCYEYSWWDENTILFKLGGPPKLLAVESGRSHRLARMEEILEVVRPLAEPLLAHVPHGAPPWDPSTGVSWDAKFSVQRDRVFINLWARTGSALVSVTRNLDQPVLHGLFDNWRLPTYVVTDTPGLFYAWLERGTGKGFETKRVWFGTGADEIDADWLPLSSVTSPEFGFHLLAFA